MVTQIFRFITAAVLFTACETSTGNPSSKSSKSKAKIIFKDKKGSDGSLELDSTIFEKHLTKLKTFAAANNYTTQYAMLVDLGMHSGAKRFFLVNLVSGKILHSGLVTHGSSPSALQPGQRQYSNVNGSLCSSLGRYKIGAPYQGQFGLAYKLYGLDKTNSNAFARFIVLHSHSCVPDVETEEWICQSWGCPTVSPNFLKTISSYIDKSAKPMLLEMYDSGEK